MEGPKLHHYVPRWYLEKFVDPQSGFLHVYDKTTQLWRKQKPNKVMAINRYYRQEHVPEGIDPDIFEKLLGSSLEPNAKNAFEKLLSHPQDFTDEDTASIIFYLELQYLRVPRQAEMAKRLLERAVLLNAPPDTATAIMRGKIAITINESFRFNFIRMLIGSLDPYFARMEWTVVKAEEGASFITSDNPLAFFNNDVLPPLEAGINLVGTMVFFPLNSQHLLILQHPELLRGRPASRLDRIPKPQLEDGRIGVNYGREWTEEQVNEHSWITLQLCHKMIVGRSKETLQKAVDSV